MARRPFTEEERAHLLSLPAVASIEGDTIKYARSFRNECMRRYYDGESPTEIFRSAGLDPQVLGRKRIEGAISRWSQARTDGEGAPERAAVTAAEQRDLHQQIRALTSEIEVLRGVVALSGALDRGGVRKTRRFELIEELRQKDPDLVVSVACEALGVSLSGYYRWRASAVE